MKYPTVRLGDLCLSKPQYGANAKAIARTSGDQPRYIRITDIDSNGELSPNSVAADVADEKPYLLKPGDLLIARSGNTVGKSYLHSEEAEAALFAGYLIRFQLQLDRINPKFVFYFTKSELYERWLDSKRRVAGQPNINGTEYASLEIPLPPLHEQDRIVEILDQADTLRQQRRQADALSQRILPALFNETFGELHINTKGWPLKTLQKLGRIVTGSTPPSKNEGMFDGPIPFVTPSDLKETWVNHNRSVTELGATQSRTVRTGSTFVCCIGATIGKMGKAAHESAFNQQINAIEWHDASYDSYGLEALKQIKNQIIAGASSTTLPIMNKSTFQALQIPCPPKELRLKFAGIVAEIEAIYTNQVASHSTIDSLFQTLLHRAFDGSLTTKWREGHAKELLQEMEHQAR